MFGNVQLLLSLLLLLTLWNNLKQLGRVSRRGGGGGKCGCTREHNPRTDSWVHSSNIANLFSIPGAQGQQGPSVVCPQQGTDHKVRDMSMAVWEGTSQWQMNGKNGWPGYVCQCSVVALSECHWQMATTQITAQHSNRSQQLAASRR